MIEKIHKIELNWQESTEWVEGEGGGVERKQKRESEGERELKM